jgi:hypothetical protein
MSLLLAAALAAAPTAPLNLNPVWATLTRKPDLRLTSTKLEVGTIAGRHEGGLQFWLKRTITERDGAKVVWTTTLACPAAKPALARMEDISASPDVPGVGAEDGEIILHGMIYTLEAPGRVGSGGGGFRISSNLHTPLARWADSTLAALEPCWSTTAPGN